MNKFAIPAILVATVMVAGLFAFAPVEQVSTVHNTLSTNLTTVTSNSVPAVDGDFINITTTEPIMIYSIRVTTDGLDGGDFFGLPASAWEWDGSTGGDITDRYGSEMTDILSTPDGTIDILHAQKTDFHGGGSDLIYPMIVTDFVNIEVDVSGIYDITVTVIYEGTSSADVNIDFSSP